MLSSNMSRLTMGIFSLMCQKSFNTSVPHVPCTLAGKILVTHILNKRQEEIGIYASDEQPLLYIFEGKTVIKLEINKKPLS